VSYVISCKDFFPSEWKGRVEMLRNISDVTTGPDGRLEMKSVFKSQ